MCRSKEQGGRRCAGRRKKNTEAEVSAATETAAAETVVVEAPRLNPDTPQLNHLLTVSPEQWFDTPWAERKQVITAAFFEARTATGTTAEFGGYNRMTKALGRCSWQQDRWSRQWSTAKIHLADVGLRIITPANIAKTIAHELAHAQAGPHGGHGSAWRGLFEEAKDTLGIDSETNVRHSYEEVEVAHAVKLAQEKAAKPPVWLGLCPQGHRFGAGRKITNTYLCLKCDSRTHTQDERIITYTRNTNKETL